MAWFIDHRGGARAALPARLLIGRSASCKLRLDDPRASSEHAVVQWAADQWEVRDLGSRNGTFVGGQRLPTGGRASLSAGAVLGFGAPDAALTLVDASAPGVVAWPLGGGEPVVADDGVLALPSADEPVCTVFVDTRGRFIVERLEEDPRVAVDGELLVVGARSYQLSLPVLYASTATSDAGLRLDAVHLAFRVSRDQEHVALTVRQGSRAVQLDAREHLYVLWLLAGARCEDAHLPPDAQGWRDRETLLRMLRTDTNGLNVAIFRARGQLAAAGVDGAADIVEVRRGQRRIGVSVDRLDLGEP